MRASSTLGNVMKINPRTKTLRARAQPRSTTTCQPRNRNRESARRHIVAVPRSTRDKPAKPEPLARRFQRTESLRFDIRARENNPEDATEWDSRLPYRRPFCSDKPAGDRAPGSESQTDCKCGLTHLRGAGCARVNRLP